MTRGELIYEGKAKRVYNTPDDGLCIMEFKDSATAFNGQKRGEIQDKGILNALLSVHFFNLLEKNGVPTHMVEPLSERELLVRRLAIVPVELVIRNIAAGSLAKRLGLEEGVPMPFPIVEMYYKRDDLGDPMINRNHARALDLAGDTELDRMESLGLMVNSILRKELAGVGIELVDFKLEFGLEASGPNSGRILLGDEISPDTCRFWDTATKEKLDKDRFRRDLGGVEEAYREVVRRVIGG
ncbi:MAG: phosphoribosylaminoimidazolesuccinocarboxamide synthase [Firmicutes bacterium]|nr:phosphoribosylaminoimidazolesuccinocarboxamide synthase [Bacillota bacterium]